MLSKCLLCCLLAAMGTSAAERSSWLTLVSPVMTKAERARYLSLSPEARGAFEKNFWTGKAVTEQVYLERVQYIDANFGSGKAGSGVNTDQGRVYLSIGPPNRMTRVPSSRIFFPVDIWYYETVPSLGMSSEVRLIFYQKNGIGFPKLYSPTLDTIRLLMVPQANTIGMFGPNQTISAADIQTQLTTRPVESEVAEAAVSVAAGVTNEGNDEILALLGSPEEALSGRRLRTSVKSKLLLARGKLDAVQSPSEYGGTQVDLSLRTTVQKKLRLEVLEGGVQVYQSELTFRFDRPRLVQYQHRLDLLPGRYSVLLTTDVGATAFPLNVLTSTKGGSIVLSEEAPSCSSQPSPFRYAGRCVSPASDGNIAVLSLDNSNTVRWAIRRGLETVWKKDAPASAVSVADIPFQSLAPGKYILEASSPDGSRQLELTLPLKKEEAAPATVSFNANLRPAQRLRFVGHQWLLRGDLDRARQSLTASLAASPKNNDDAWVELSRVDASAGHYDEARNSLRPILAAHPDNFEALATLAYIEAKLQDYPVAAGLYRQALAIQDSPAIRIALGQLAK